jgi:hypothetical protein
VTLLSRAAPYPIWNPCPCWLFGPIRNLAHGPRAPPVTPHIPANCYRVCYRDGPAKLETEVHSEGGGRS